MEHYLGEKLKNLRESRNWSQAELAKRLNKAVSTISGYESDAHAIPLDVLVSISLLFGVSTDELLDLETTNVLSLSGLTEEQCNLLRKIRQEYLSPSQRGKGTASIDLLVEVAISLNTTLDFLILGVLDTPRERELNAQIKKQHQKIQIFKNKLSNLIDQLDTSASV